MIINRTVCAIAYQDAIAPDIAPGAAPAVTLRVTRAILAECFLCRQGKDKNEDEVEFHGGLCVVVVVVFPRYERSFSRRKL